MTVGMKKLGCRTVMAIGGLLNALGFMVSGFAEDIRVFYFSHGFLCGTLNVKDLIEIDCTCDAKMSRKSQILDMSHVARKPVFGICDEVDSNRPAQLQKLGRSSKFRIQKQEIPYYLDSEQQRR